MLIGIIQLEPLALSQRGCFLHGVSGVSTADKGVHLELNRVSANCTDVSEAATKSCCTDNNGCRPRVAALG